MLRDQRRKGEINCTCVCAINRQNYGPCQYGTPSLNSSPALYCPFPMENRPMRAGGGGGVEI
jgi:hypothetical protein